MGNGKTVLVEKEAYSKEELRKIKKAFVELRKASHSKSAQDYVKKVEVRLKA